MAHFSVKIYLFSKVLFYLFVLWWWWGRPEWIHKDNSSRAGLPLLSWLLLYISKRQGYTKSITTRMIVMEDEPCCHPSAILNCGYKSHAKKRPTGREIVSLLSFSFSIYSSSLKKKKIVLAIGDKHTFVSFEICISIVFSLISFEMVSRCYQFPPTTLLPNRAQSHIRIIEHYVYIRADIKALSIYELLVRHQNQFTRREKHTNTVFF